MLVWEEDIGVHQPKYGVPRLEASATEYADFIAVYPDVVEFLISETTTRDDRSE